MALRGFINGVDRANVHGCVQDEHKPETPVSLLFQIDSMPATRVLANVYREDLERNGIGDGRYSVSVKLTGISPLSAHVLHVIREDDGVDMPGSPIDIPAVMTFDAKLMDEVAKSLSEGADEAELLVRAGFLAQQVDRLLQASSDKRADRPHHMSRHQFRVRWSGRGPMHDPGALPRAFVIDASYPTPLMTQARMPSSRTCVHCSGLDLVSCSFLRTRQVWLMRLGWRRWEYLAEPVPGLDLWRKCYSGKPEPPRWSTFTVRPTHVTSR